MLELVHKEDWALKNWCFQILVLENTLDRVPWTARRSDQSILKEINPGYSLEGLMLKLTLWLTCWKRPWCWERLKVGGEGDARGWDDWMASLTQWTWVWQTLGDGEGLGSLACCSPWGQKELDTTEWLNNNKIQALLDSSLYLWGSPRYSP